MHFSQLSTFAVLAAAIGVQAAPTAIAQDNYNTTLLARDIDTLTGSCTCSGDIDAAPFYMIHLPANVASIKDVGPHCPAQGFIDNFDALLSQFSCRDNPDGSMDFSFRSTVATQSAVDLAIEAATDQQFSTDCFGAQNPTCFGVE